MAVLKQKLNLVVPGVGEGWHKKVKELKGLTENDTLDAKIIQQKVKTKENSQGSSKAPR